MKDKIHPKVNPVVFLDVMSGTEFVASSTLRSDETKKIEGVEHFVIRVETSSASHPFYTGNQKTATKSDQVAKFMEKVAKAQSANQKKVKEVKIEEEAAPKGISKAAQAIAEAAEKNTIAKEEARAAAKIEKAAKAAKTVKTVKPATKKATTKKAAPKKK